MDKCKYNNYINCDEENCEDCGWNPNAVNRQPKIPTLKHIRCEHCGCIKATIVSGIGVFHKPCPHELTGNDKTIPDGLWMTMMKRVYLYYNNEEDNKTESGLLTED